MSLKPSLMQRFGRVLWAGGLTVAALMLMAAGDERAATMLGPEGPDDGDDSGPVRRFVYLDESLELNDLVHKAGFFEIQENWTKAFEIYQQVLREAKATTLVRLDDRTFGNLRLHVCRHLAQMPAERRHEYRLLYDDRARALLEASLNPLSVDGLEQVATVFFISSVGDDALDILGDVYRERGEWERAVAHWRRALSVYPDTDLPQAALWAKVVTGCVALEDGRRAAEALRALKTVAGERAVVALAGTDVSLVERFEPAIGRLPALRLDSAGRDGWPQVGGTAAHVAVAPTLGPADAWIWSHPLEKPAVQVSPNAYPAYLRLAKTPTPAAVVCPVAVGSHVFFHDGESVYALDATTGKRIWKHTEPLKALSTRDPRTNRVIRYPASSAAGQTACAVQADRVYAVLGGRGAQQAKVVALDRATGRRVWSLAIPPPGGNIKGPLGHVSQAVVSGGSVYVRLAVHDTGSTNIYYGGGHMQHHVLAIDARTGRLRWSRFVCTAAPMYAPYYGHLPVLDPQLVVPAADARQVYISTNGGAVAALDVRSGEVAWATLYEPSTYDPRSRLRLLAIQRRVSDAKDATPPWRSSAPLVLGDRVLFTPTDSDALICLEAETGRLLWKRPREKAQFVVGAQDGRVFVVGDRVEAVDATTGRLLWRAKRHGLDPTGNPFLTEDCLFVPEKDRLYRFDVASGRQIGAMRFPPKTAEAETGNMVWVGPTLVTASATHLNGFSDRRSVMAGLAARIKANPRDAEAHFQVGEIYARSEEYEAAIRKYREGLAVCPPDLRYQDSSLRDVFRSRLYEHHLAATGAFLSQRKYERALAHATDCLGFATDPQRRLEAKLQMIASYRALGNFVEVANTFQSVLLEEPDAEYALTDGGYTKAGLHARHQLEMLIKERGRGVYAAHDAAAGKLLAAGDRGSLECVLDAYPNSTAYVPAMRVYGDVLLAAGDRRHAVIQYRRYLRLNGRSERAQTWVKMIGALEALGRVASARRALGKLLEERPKDHVLVDGKRIAVASYVSGMRARPAFAQLPKSHELVLPELTLPVKRAWSKTMSRPTFVTIPLEPDDGKHAYICSAASVLCLDSTTGKVRWQRQAPGFTHIQRAVSDGASVVVSDGLRLASIDLKQGAVEWHRTMPQPKVAQAGGARQQVQVAQQAGQRLVLQLAGLNAMRMYLHGLAVSDEGVLVVRRVYNRQKGARQTIQSEVTFFDRAAGQVRWTRTLHGHPYQTPLLMEDTALVCSQNPYRMVALETDDGSVRHEWQIGDGRTSRILSPPTAISPDVVCLASWRGGNRQEMMAVDPHDGRVQWRARLQADPRWRHQPIALERRGKAVLALARRGACSAIDLNTGKTLWQSKFPSATTYAQQITSSDEGIYYTTVTNVKGKQQVAVTCLDMGKGGSKRWSLTLPVEGHPRDMKLSAEHVVVAVSPFRTIAQRFGNRVRQNRVGLPPVVYLLNLDDGQIEAALETSKEGENPRFTYQPVGLMVRDGHAFVATQTDLLAFGPDKGRRGSMRSRIPGPAAWRRGIH